jgi:hypothetical protein|tara:strand:+ start:241 stop:579 length:339 start_codon:yes stop_codon:yes gene_type:complete
MGIDRCGVLDDVFIIENERARKDNRTRETKRKETQNETKKRTPREATRRSLSAHNHAETHDTVFRGSHRDRACSPVFLFFLPPSFSLFSFRLCNNADSAYNKHVFSLAGKIN